MGKDQIFSGKVQPCKSEGSQGDDHQHDGSGDHGEKQGVPQVSSQRNSGKSVHVVLQSGRQGEKLRNIFCIIGAVAFYGGQYHPVKGEQYDQRPQTQKKVDDPIADIAVDPGAFLDSFIIRCNIRHHKDLLSYT